MFQACINKLSKKQDLTVAEMESALDAILAGGVSETDIVLFLVLLRDKGESAAEIKGAVTVLRQRAQKLHLKSKEIIDTCGTGGDRKNTFNISTASAFIVAGAGVPVAKHGNRAVSSSSGSADVLKKLGVNIEAPPAVVVRCVDEIGIGFLFAPVYHPVLKAVAAARQKVGTKTIFNIVGPLMNPAGARKQMIGVYDPLLLPVIASVLKDLGSESLAVVHGDDGLDEVTLTTKTQICFLKEGKIFNKAFDPRSVGYPFCRPEALRGGTAEENAHRLRKMLSGHSQAVDHCVHLNAALALMVAGKAADFREGLLLAQESISSGRAYEKLEALVEMSNVKVQMSK
ncbi:MAG: anthranilate phosphoribosyltransferase [Deltaproteobacteria bacterium]|nr:anthranilate phosphoribosyltransferase [Deltaproteobacteria bacterium]